MKKLFLFFIVCLAIIDFTHAQSSGKLTIFSDKGEKFFLFLDGERKNETPQAKVSIDNLTRISYNVKIIYDDAARTSIARNNLFISDADDNLMDVAYRISHAGAAAKLKFYSMNTVTKEIKQEVVTIRPKTTAPVNQPLYGTLHIFSEQGDKFFVYLNGERQNDVPQADVRIEKLTATYYQVKIFYSDNRFNIVAKNNVYIADEEDNMMDVTYKLSRTNLYGKLRFYSMNPVDYDFVAPAGMYVYNYGESGKNNKKTAVVTNLTVNNTTVPVKKDSAIKDNTVKTTLKKEPAKTSSISAPPVQKNTVTKNTQPVNQAKKNVTDNNNTVTKTTTAVETKNAVSIKEPSGWVCQNEWPMWKVDYANAKKNIGEAKTEKLKLTAAKDLVTKNCLSCDQVAEIGSLLTTEESRLEFAKFAFSHTIDIRNYLKVIRIFTSAKSKNALTEFIGG